MANEQNLKPFDTLAESRQREIRRMGQAAQVKKHNERKAMRCVADILLGARAELDADEQAAFERMGIDTEEMTVQMKLVWAQVLKGFEGDTRAAEFVRDTAGEKPKDSMAMSHEISGNTEIRLWFPNDNTD